MITLSDPIVTLSPIETPSWMRTWARMSLERPMIAPSTRDERPMCVDASITDPARARTLAERNAGAENAVRADRRVGADPAVGAEERGPSTTSRSSSSTVSPIQMFPRSRTPGTSSCTRPSSASKFACRYWSRLPMSCQ